MGDTPSPPPPPRSCHKLFRNLQGVIDFVLVSIDGMDGWMEPDGDLRLSCYLDILAFFIYLAPFLQEYFWCISACI